MSGWCRLLVHDACRTQRCPLVESNLLVGNPVRDARHHSLRQRPREPVGEILQELPLLSSASGMCAIVSTPRDETQDVLRADRVGEAAHLGPKLSQFSPGSWDHGRFRQPSPNSATNWTKIWRLSRSKETTTQLDIGSGACHSWLLLKGCRGDVSATRGDEPTH